MAQSSRLGSPNSKAVAMASDGIVSDNRQESMASDGLFGEVDPVPPTPAAGEPKSLALSTLGVIASSKSLSMASLGTLGAASPIPPTPIVGHGQQNEMLIGVGEMM